MAGSNIFISYSHKDEQTLERLLTFIKPLERNGLVDCWVDTRIEAGADWKQEIDTALDVAAIAVLVISQDFLASDFIFKEELPRILERESRGELEILPVFLRTSDVDKLKIPYSDRHGQPQHAILSRFQGFGTPDKPLMDLTFQNREKQYKKLIDRLRKLADEKAPKPTVSRPPTVSPRAGHKPIRAAPTQTVPMREYRLTIHIERHAEELRVSHYLPGTDAIASRTLPRDDVIRLSTKTLTASAGVSYGNQLFDLLFGQEVEWEGILRQLFHESAPGYHPTPIRHPVHCRICTTEPQLSSLSWRQTSWNEYRLSDYGWTFSTTQTLHPVEDINTTAPCNVLIVIAQGNNPQITPDQQHPQAIADVLQKVWSTGTEQRYLRLARNRQELEHALVGMRPHLIYICGQAVLLNQRPALLLQSRQRDTGDIVGLHELAGLLRNLQPRPALVYLNLYGADAAAADILQALSGVVPLLIVRFLPHWHPAAAAHATSWLNDWLQRGSDPLTALHEVHKYDTAEEAASLLVNADYRDWITATRLSRVYRRFPELALDREHQKALVAKQLRDLARSDTRRVMTLIAYASAGNRLDSLHEQLRYYLDLEVDDVVAIEWLDLQLPPGKANLLRDLEFDIATQLEAGHGEDIRHLLRRRAPRAVAPGKRPVIWLNWGVIDQEDKNSQLSPPQLRDWIRCCSEFLGNRCPDDLRLVCYIALELSDERERHKKLADALQEYRKEPWCRHAAFRMNVLPPLGKVAEQDLFDFLEDPDNSSCPANIHTEIAERLIQRTGGRFDDTVKLMEQAEQGSWYDLLEQLQREQGVTTIADDEPF